MKSILAIAMAALMVLSFVSVASAADTVEIRSPVFSGASTNALVPGQATDYTDFAAFWYDIDEGLGSEAFTIVADPTPDNTIDEGFLEYTANVQDVDYTYEPWSAAPVPVADQTFQKLGFLGEVYVPVNNDPQILSTLILNDDEKYTIRIGEALDLGEGFAFTPKQIDVEGYKVWLELTKDGKFLDDDVYDATPGTDTNPDHKSWDYEADVAGEEDVVIMRVHVDEVNQSGNFIIIEGLWLITDEAMEIEDDDEFGKMEVVSGPDDITLKSTEDITLGKDDLIDVIDTIKIKTADSDDLRFYFFEELTEPGTYEIRGTVASPSGAGFQVWDYRSFAGFFYDLDDNLASETLNITWEADNRTVAEDTGVVYTSTMLEMEYEYEGWVNTSTPTFTKMGFLAVEYVPIENDPQILSKLIIDDDEKYTLRVGQSLDLGEGFALTPKQIDVEGDKVWLELSKDGKFLDDEVYNTLNNDESTSWEYDIDVAGEDDVVIMRVHVNEVFQGQVDSLAIIEGLWLISDEPMEIADDEKFGMLEVQAVTATSITLENTNEEVNLNADDTINLTDDMKLQVADDNANVRFYPFMEYEVIEVIIENEIPTANISSIMPNIADVGDLVTFSGTGTDNDGSITAYLWTSDLDGQLSTSENFSTSGLSLGTHTIYFSVQDDDSVWSATDSATVTINEKPNVAPTAEILSIDPSTATEGTEITFNGSGTDSDGTIIGYDWNSSIDGQLSTSENFSTSGLSLGTHTVYFKVQDNDGVWSAIDSVAVNIIDDLAPEAHISAYPLEYISIYNPVTINLNSTDAHLASTELIIADSEGHEIINLTIAKDDPNSATYEYVWNATDKDELPVSSGAYILFVNSTDTSGNFASANVSITVDNEKPIVTFEDIRGFTSDNNIVYTNATLLINVSASGTPGDVNSVEYTLSSTFTNYKKNMSAELIDGNWTAIFDLSCIHDDGQYILTANAIDAAMNLNSTVSDTLIVVDRTSPIFSSTASMYNETHGMVSVISSESVIGYPIVEVNSDVIEVAQTSGKWTGYFQLDTEQIFNVNVTGTDIAGNIGSGSSVVVIEKIEFTNGTGLFNSSQIDTFITFNTTNDTIGNIIVTESMDPMANLTDDSIGLYFISVELDSNLKENISSAIIAIPINSVTLPDGINTKDVSILYCNETEELWEICPTSIEIIDGKEYWITYVNHFSIYGVVVSDTIAPILDSVTPVSGTTFAQDTTFVNIRFNYNDQQSGINVSSIIFNFDDIEITDNSLEITSNYTSYNATGLSSGSYTASITVADNAGNSVPFSTSFSITDGLDNVVDDNDNGGGGGGGGSGATGEAFENIALKNVKTEDIVVGLEISYTFDEEQNAIEYINFSALRNYGRVSTTIEVLKNRSAMVDESAPGVVYSNLNIWVGRAGFATEDNIADPVIGFIVAKAWVIENGIDGNSIALYRHSEGKWNALNTMKVGEDDSYIYFESETPGFSPFAIVGFAEEDESVPRQDITLPSEEGISAAEDEDTQPEPKGIPWISTGSLILILVGVHLLMGKRS